jgi:hypothetical protein
MHYSPAPDHYSSSTKLYSWHYALGQVAFSWHPPNPDLFVGLPDGEAWFITPENAFQLLQGPIVGELYTTPADALVVHGDLRRVCGCSAMETHFMKFPTVIVLTLLPDAVWNSAESVATEDRPFFLTTRFSTRRPCSVSLCGLPLRGWAVVAPRCFHFTITALTALTITARTVGKVASYDSAMLNDTKLFSAGHSTANVCL